MKLHVEIIDDFLPDPEKFREEALKAPFYEIRSHEGESYKNINVRPSNEFEGLLGQRLRCDVKIGYSLLRRNFEGELPNHSIHSDNGYDDYAGVLYLNRPEDCKGGTAFWKWRELDTHNFPTEAEIRRLGKKPLRVYQKLHEAYNRPEEWEQVHVAEMKFNRLVVYPTKTFHSRWPLAAFGTTPETARMIVAMFFSIPGNE